MKHYTLPRFWQCCHTQPRRVQLLAIKNYKLLKKNPAHPSLHFKKIGKDKQLWSVRIGIGYRALSVDNLKESTGFGSAHMQSTTG